MVLGCEEFCRLSYKLSKSSIFIVSRWSFESTGLGFDYNFLFSLYSRFGLCPTSFDWAIKKEFERIGIFDDTLSPGKVSIVRLDFIRSRYTKILLKIIPIDLHIIEFDQERMRFDVRFVGIFVEFDKILYVLCFAVFVRLCFGRLWGSSCCVPRVNDFGLFGFPETLIELYCLKF